MKKLFALILMLAMVLSMVACGGAETPAAPETPDTPDPAPAPADEIVIGLSFDAIESQMWVENQKVIHATLDEMGIKYTEVVADGDAQKQNQQIETLIAAGVDAIIIAPKDSATIVSAIKKCNEAGIPVIMNNRGAGEGCEVACSVASDNKAMATREFEYIAAKAKESGATYKVMEFIGNLGDTNAVARHEGYKEVAAKYPEIFVETIEINTEWKNELVDSLGQAALQANPDINLIFTPSDNQIPTVKAMLQKFDKWYPAGDEKHVTWVTFDGAADAVNEIKAGYIDVVSVQDASEQGRLCAVNAVALAKGETVDPNAFDPGFEVTLENVEELGFAGY